MNYIITCFCIFVSRKFRFSGHLLSAVRVFGRALFLLRNKCFSASEYGAFSVVQSSAKRSWSFEPFSDFPFSTSLEFSITCLTSCRFDTTLRRRPPRERRRGGVSCRKWRRLLISRGKGKVDITNGAFSREADF